MAKSKRKRTAAPRGVSIRAARKRIDELGKRSVRIASEPENLSLPIDPAVEVVREGDRRHVFLKVDNVIVSQLWVIEFDQQIGSRFVRMGGIGDVATHDDHRFKGYMRRVLTGALRCMRREGFDTSMLFGITSFYPKFGYAPAFPGTRFFMAVRDAEAVEPGGYRFVDYTPKHLRAVLRMYRSNSAGRIGPVRRDPKSWRPFRLGASWNSKAVVKVALDGRGRPVGYFARDDRHLHAIVIEIGYATPKVLPDILRAMARHAWSQRLEEIGIFLPEDHLFVEFCKPLGLRKEVRYNRDGEAQVRMINIPAALTKVADELAPRMKGTGWLNIRTNLDDVGLAWSRGKLRVGPPDSPAPTARMPQWALAQLFYGYRSASGLAATGTLRAGGQALESLERMFPVRPHYHYDVDNF